MFEVDVTKEQALWYAHLPDKVKRNIFSPDEQLLLSARRPSTVLDVSNKPFYNLGGRGGNRSLPSLHSCDSDHTSAYDSEDESVEEKLVESSRGMDDSIVDTFEWLNHGNLDLSLDDYHIHVAEESRCEPPKPIALPGYHHGYAHGRLVTAMPPGLPSLKQSLTELNKRSESRSWSQSPQWHSEPSSAITEAPRSPALTPGSALRRSTSQSILARNIPLFKRSTQRSTSHDQPLVPAIDSPAAHVSDPAARLKLRMYLASAAKFDEALEFGFPSHSTVVAQMPASKRPSTTSSCQPPHPHMAALDEAGEEFLDARRHAAHLNELLLQTTSDSDGSRGRPSLSLTATSHDDYSPLTPSFDTEVGPGMGKGMRLPPLSSAGECDIGAREMTLRMTLTRKDLRADERLLYPEQAPEAWEGWGVEKEDSGLLKKFWRGVKDKF